MKAARRTAAVYHVVLRDRPGGHAHEKNAVRKSKKSCEFTTASSLKSALGSLTKNALRKSKKSCEFTVSSALKSAPHTATPLRMNGRSCGTSGAALGLPGSTTAVQAAAPSGRNCRAFAPSGPREPARVTGGENACRSGSVETYCQSIQYAPGGSVTESIAASVLRIRRLVVAG